MNSSVATVEAARSLAKVGNRQLLIGGKLCAPSGGDTMDVVSPVDGRPLGVVAKACRVDVYAAVDAAKRAFETWRWTDVDERRRCLLALADHLRRDSAVYSALDAIDSGSPLAVMKRDVEFAAASIEFVAGLAWSWTGTQVPTGTRAIDFTVREPYGVVARVVPFNHPLAFAAGKIAAPLLTGNTVVLKLADQASLSGLRLCDALVELFPPGVINVISGVGAEAGDALVRHPDVGRIGFIGSRATGKAILRAAADTVTPVTLELGGKNAFIVCADANLGEAVDAAINGMNFGTAGQSCGSFSRLFVHQELYDEAISRLAERIADVRVRNPFDESAQMGALISDGARERCEGYIETAREGGARLVAGGRRLTGKAFGGGYYLEPVLLADVTADMPVATEEVFGPVLAAMPWSTVDEVIAGSNGTPYGLTAGVWCRDLDLAMRLVEDLEVGTVSVNGNGTQHHTWGAPFGGYKESGYGKEEHVGELLDWTREKNVNVQLHEADEGHLLRTSDT